MGDTILARFKASHSAQGMQLAARQAGLIPGSTPVPPLPAAQLPAPNEEAGDIA